MSANTSTKSSRIYSVQPTPDHAVKKELFDARIEIVELLDELNQLRLSHQCELDSLHSSYKSQLKKMATTVELAKKERNQFAESLANAWETRDA